MKDPIEQYEKQGRKLDEIFGWLNRTFGSKSPSTPYQSPIQHNDTDKDCSPLGYKMSVGDKLNTKVAGSMGAANVTIGLNKIQNIKGLQFELVDNKGKGTGRFRNAVVRDFKCYDEDKDLYGIKWLFEIKVSYEAESISGQLKANRKNQGVDFKGKWNDGVFFGTFMSDPNDFNGTRGQGAVILSASKTKGKPKTTSRNTRKKNTAQGRPQPTLASTQTTVTPMTAGPIIPTSVATSPTAPVAPTGKKGKKITSENTVLRKTITIRGFLDTFM
jgi:hypothetical protein